MPRYSLNVVAPLASPKHAATQVWRTASAWQRAAAYMWDALLFLVLLQLLAAILLTPPPALEILLHPTTIPGPLPSPDALIAELIGYLARLLMLSSLVWCVYMVWHVAFEACQGTTPGKWLVGLRVAVGVPGTPAVDQAGVGWRVAIVRFFASSLSWLTLNLGHGMARWRKDRAALHDLVSKTQVIEDPEVVLSGWVLPATVHRAAVVLGMIILVGLCLSPLVMFVYQLVALADSVN